MTDRMTISSAELSEVLTARGDPHSVEAAIRLMEAMDWIRVVTCAFCGAAYPNGTPETKHERLTQHIMECPEHPIRKVKANLDAAETRMQELEKERDRLAKIVETHSKKKPI